MKPRMGMIGGVLVVAFFGAMHCGKDPVSSHGTGSSTETAMVAGIFYNRDHSPAKNVKVYLRKKTYLANISAFLGKKSAMSDAASATTDDKGKFSITTIDTGIYVLEGTDGGNNLALNDSVPVKYNDSTVILPPDTLEPAGAIKGIVRLSNGGDPRKVFVLAFGIDKFAQVNTDGSFKFLNLARGKYDVRLIPVLDNYEVLDEFNIPVQSADTTNLDTVRLPYTGIPIPTGLKISYDPSMPIVTLTWNKPTTGTKVQSYSIFRERGDSTSFVNIKSGVTDTNYIDSTVVSGQTYKYGVAAVDTNNTTGIMSATVSILIESYFQVDTLFGDPGSGPGQIQGINSVTVDRNGNLYISDYSKIQKFNNNLEFQFEIDTIGVLSINVDSSGNIYSCSDGSILPQMIKVFSPNGTFTNSLVVGPIDSSAALTGNDTNWSQGIGDVCLHNNELFIIVYKDFLIGYPGNPQSIYRDSVVVMDLHGSIKRSWATTHYPQQPLSININNSNDVFITTSNSIQIYDTMGNFKSSITPAGFSGFGKVAFDSKGRIIVNAGSQLGELWVFDKNGNSLAKYNLQNFLVPANETWARQICTNTLGGKDFIYVVLYGQTNKVLKLFDMLP